MSDDAVMKAMHMGGLPWDQRTVDEGEAAYKALQERAEKLDSGIREALDIITGWTVRRPDDVEAIGDILNAALSPTQETDPEAQYQALKREGTYRPVTDEAKQQAREWATRETDPE